MKSKKQYDPKQTHAFLCEEPEELIKDEAGQEMENEVGHSEFGGSQSPKLVVHGIKEIYQRAVIPRVIVTESVRHKSVLLRKIGG